MSLVSKYSSPSLAKSTPSSPLVALWSTGWMLFKVPSISGSNCVQWKRAAFNVPCNACWKPCGTGVRRQLLVPLAVGAPLTRLGATNSPGCPTTGFLTYLDSSLAKSTLGIRPVAPSNQAHPWPHPTKLTHGPIQPSSPMAPSNQAPHPTKLTHGPIQPSSPA